MSTVSSSGHERPQTVQQYVLSALRREIGSGRLRPGEPIRQEALAADLGVSRVPLREALKILEGEGQVYYRPHRGYSVVELSMDELYEVYRIRELLESEAVRIAVAQGSSRLVDDVRAAETEVARASAEEDLARMTAANRRFHFLLFDGAGMPHLARLIRILWDSTDAYRAVYYNDGDNRRCVLAEHRGIVEALAAGRADDLVAHLNLSLIHI